MGERGAPSEVLDPLEADTPPQGYGVIPHPPAGTDVIPHPPAGTNEWFEWLRAARRAGFMEGVARTLAQPFCLLVGGALIATGILGFSFGGTSFDSGEGIRGNDLIEGDELILFEVNGWHNVAHIATGAFLVVMSPKAASAALGALIFGALYAVVAVWGFVEGDQILEWIATDTSGNWLHAVFAAAGMLIGLSAGAFDVSARRLRSRIGLGRR